MKSFFAIAIVAATLLAVNAHADAVQSASYAAPATPIVSLTGSIAGQNIGGVTFASNGQLPTEITVTDASGMPVAFTVCQPATTIGGQVGNCDATSPSVAGCGSADLATSVIPFDAVRQVNVFVTLTGDPTASPQCVGPATTGTVYLTTVG